MFAIPCIFGQVADLKAHYDRAFIESLMKMNVCYSFFAGNVVSRAYLIYKWAVALFLLINQIISLMNNFYHATGSSNRASKYWIYATHWGFISITLAVTLDAILVLARYVSQRERAYKNHNPHYEQCHAMLKISMSLTATAYPLALFVTLIFWTFLFDFENGMSWSLGSYVNLAVHLFQVHKSSFWQS